ncbi:V [Simian adenovirus 19]|uniref:Core-capsid bridging protein n=1 Tax=Simian adenovirus 19 TaxID=38416 RepID=A0A0M3TH33_9ADEN|nr:V [Simian adenovirus 19] [Simian adenovirus 19]ALE30430.1 V [Simian adenovirus 19] [Simian adenovirus 19]
MSKRKFKEELLQTLAPEIYGPPDVKPDIKPRDIKRVKKREKKEELAMAAEAAAADDAVEFVRSFAPRRRVQWKGRRVQRVLRPGTTVVFTPGQRSAARGFKRQYDEVYGDEDILEQAAQQIGEFAYGKRSRRENVALALDEGNPTPSLKAVTLQQVLPVSVSTESKRGMKRELDLQPTLQLMVPKRQKLEEVLENMKVDPTVEPDVKVRPIKEVAPGLGVQTVDIQIPVSSSPAAVEAMETQTETPAPATREIALQTEPWYEYATPLRSRRPRRYAATSALMPEYALHPSITPTPGYRGVTFRPAGTRRRSRRRTSRRRSRRVLAPVSVRRVTRRGRTVTIPNPRYHPSIL